MIQIIDYDAGNIGSISNALKQLGEKFRIVSFGQNLNFSEKVIFPGVGAAGSAMKNLKNRGFLEILPKLTMPFLGICLGMQLLLNSSDEGEAACLGIIPGEVVKFSGEVKVPQIGWNQVEIGTSEGGDLLFRDVPDESYFYFVHSYFVVTESLYVLANSYYGEKFASAIRYRNFYGVQFHPEKSGEMGLRLLNNFCKIC